MNREQMQQRTMAFAIRVIRLCEALPQNSVGWAVSKQLVRCGTSVGANYRASGRARSDAEFIAKLGIVEEEADECCFWLELIINSELLPESRVAPLLKEANELTAIIVTMKKTARQRSQV
ncbi:MAG: four helix bundle protein [Planctomycetota bacterium]